MHIFIGLFLFVVFLRIWYIGHWLGALLAFALVWCLCVEPADQHLYWYGFPIALGPWILKRRKLAHDRNAQGLALEVRAFVPTDGFNNRS